MRSRRTAGSLFAIALTLLMVGGPARASGPAAGKTRQDGALRGIPLAEYRARRAAAMAAMPNGLVALNGRTEEEFGDDAKFRQDNWFQYLTGVETPGAKVLLNPLGKQGERETLYLPDRNPTEERWTGPQIGPGVEAQTLFGFERVRAIGQFADDVRAALAPVRGAARECRVFVILPSGPTGKYTRAAAFADEVQTVLGAEHAPACEIADATPALTALRRAKSEAEVEQLRRAIDITGEAQRDVAATLVPGKVEYEIEAVVLAAFARNGAMRPGFPSIIGSGVNSTVLHYDENSKRIDAGDLVVVDIGAEFNFYTADITRTWPASGSFTKRQREIYQLVLDAQEAAARACKPGMSIRDLNTIARDFMRASRLRDASGNTLDGSFIHGLSHYLGMDVHDVGDVNTPLVVGDVITIEPGIYLRDESFGVRIEDDYLVTPTGLEKLSASIPSSPDAIEQMVKSRRR